MDARLARKIDVYSSNKLVLIFRTLVILLCATIEVATTQANGGCLSYSTEWFHHENTRSTVSCNGIDNHFWWLGADACAPESFVRFGNGNERCMDGSSSCVIDIQQLYRESFSFICCSENGPADLSTARQTQCFQLSICPVFEFTTPSIVFTDNSESAYIKVTTKPRPQTPPNMTIDVLGLDKLLQLNTTTVTAPPLEDSRLPFLSIYAFRFQVPRQLVIGAEVTLHFIPEVNNIPIGEMCESVSLGSVFGVRVIDSGDVTEPLTTVTPTVAPESTTESPSDLHIDSQEFCDSILIGAPIATFVVGLSIGLVTLFIFCAVQRSRSGQANKNVVSLGQRGLPPVPSDGRNPPHDLTQFLQSQTSSNGTLTTTPTPTEQQRLLAGQTPMKNPPVDLHPLHPDAISPYAVTSQVRLETTYLGAANPLQTMAGNRSSIDTQEFSGGRPSSTMIPDGTRSVAHRTISIGDISSDRSREVSPGQGSSMKPSLYSHEGNNMCLPHSSQPDGSLVFDT